MVQKSQRRVYNKKLLSNAISESKRNIHTQCLEMLVCFQKVVTLTFFDSSIKTIQTRLLIYIFDMFGQMEYILSFYQNIHLALVCSPGRNYGNFFHNFCIISIIFPWLWNFLCGSLLTCDSSVFNPFSCF